MININILADHNLRRSRLDSLTPTAFAARASQAHTENGFCLYDAVDKAAEAALTAFENGPWGQKYQAIGKA
jgi:hypothetical protein